MLERYRGEIGSDRYTDTFSRQRDRLRLSTTSTTNTEAIETHCSYHDVS